jgi:hypothetical protein
MARKKKDKDAAKDEAWSSPEMQALDNLTRQVLQVPKEEIDRREKAYKESRSK